MHEIIEMTTLTKILFALILMFGITALLTGLLIGAFGSGKTRSLGFLQMIFGWTALFVLYLFFWNPDFLWTMILVLIGGVIGIIIAIAIMFALVLKS